MSTPADIRKFSDSALQATIEKALLKVPLDVPVAVVAHADPVDGFAVSGLVRIGDQFSLMGTWEKRPGQPAGYSADLLWYPGYKRK